MIKDLYTNDSIVLFYWTGNENIINIWQNVEK